MQLSAKKFTGLSSNILKVIAAVFMVVDHVGAVIFPRVEILRILGRLAFPIFAYFIYEGCRYTRNKIRYVGIMATLGVIMTVVYYFVDRRIYFNALITFTLSILLIYEVNAIRVLQKAWQKLLVLLLFMASIVGVWFLTANFTVDYGFLGVLLPVFPAVADSIKKNSGEGLLILKVQFYAFALGLVALSLYIGYNQYYALCSLALLALYNGKRGFKLPKYSFYVFYPLHMVIIWGINLLITTL